MSGNTYWVISLVIGLAAALIVATLLVMLLRSVASIEKSVGGLLGIATGVAGNTANIPQLEATAPVLAQIVDEAVVQEAPMATEDVLLLLSVLLGAVVVAVVAVALIQVRRGLDRISEGLATLGSALETVEAEHLRPLEPAVKAINAQFDVILSALPGIAKKAAIVAERRPR